MLYDFSNSGDTYVHVSYFTVGFICTDWSLDALHMDSNLLIKSQQKCSDTLADEKHVAVRQGSLSGGRMFKKFMIIKSLACVFHFNHQRSYIILIVNLWDEPIIWQTVLVFIQLGSTVSFL